MKTTEQPSEKSTTAMFERDTGAEEQRRQKRIDATGRRAAAYGHLSLGEAEIAAMEWACPRRGLPGLSTLRPLFDEAESIRDEDVSGWLQSALFDRQGADQIAAGLKEALALHEKWLREDLFAARAENATIWFLRICVILIALVLLGGLVTRGGPSHRVRSGILRWNETSGSMNEDQRQYAALNGFGFAIPGANG
jgi:hypothetical protein